MSDRPTLLPPAPDGLRYIPFEYNFNDYVTTGLFPHDAQHRRTTALAQVVALIFDADLADWLWHKQPDLARSVTTDPSWLPGLPPRLLDVVRGKLKVDEADGLPPERWGPAMEATSRNREPGASIGVLKVWLQSGQPGELLDVFLADQLTDLRSALRSHFGQVPSSITMSGYGHHAAYWLRPGQGGMADATALGGASARRVNAQSVRAINTEVGYSLLDPACHDTGTRLLREVGTDNCKGVAPRPVTSVHFAPTSHIDLAMFASTRGASPFEDIKNAGQAPLYEPVGPDQEVVYDDAGEEGRITLRDWYEGSEAGDTLAVVCPFSDSSTIGSAKLYRKDDVVFVTCWADHGHTHRKDGKALWVFRPTQEVDVVEKLLRNRSGAPVSNSLLNLRLILTEDSRWREVFWYNERTRSVMRENESLVDEHITAFRIWCETTYGLLPAQPATKEVINAVARDNARDPLKEWLRSISWDGQPRLDSWLVEATGCDDTPLEQAFGRKFLIGSVARALRPGCKMDQVLLLVGRQGLKKSSMLAELAGPDWFADTTLNLESKDAYQQLALAWIYEMSEFYTGRTAQERLKAFISSQRDLYRAPYDTYPRWYERHTAIVASSNDDSPLRDPTGSRRFWPVRVRKVVDTGYLAETREQLWAEAVVAFSAGEPWWIETDSALDNMRAQAAADEFTADDPLEEALAEWLMDRYNATTFEFKHVFEHGLQMSAEAATKSRSKVAQALKGIGCAQLKRRRVRGVKRRLWLKPGADLPPGEEFQNAEEQERWERTRPQGQLELVPASGPTSARAK
jgi:predicted P-loop ATPase